MGITVLISLFCAEYYSMYCYAECLNVVILRVTIFIVMLSVSLLNAVMLRVIIFIVMLNVVMLNVIMLSVVAILRVQPF
jgi:hypothetical protein